jgi:hypothetical protein
MLRSLALVAIGGAAWSADFFPLQTGNVWTYREATTGGTFTVRVGTPLVSNDRVYYSVSGYVAARALVRFDEKNNGLVYLDNDTGQERLLTSFEPFEQGRWDAPLRPCAEQFAQTRDKRQTIDAPAGHFENALDLRYDVIGCADVGVQSELYGESIGLLQRTVGTIAGPRTYDLVYARIGESEIEAGPVGRFSVSVSQSGPLTVTMRLRIDPVASVPLHFNTGQEYDATIEDSTGQTVWRWSDGMGFVQTLHNKTVVGEWTIEIPVAAPQLPRALAESRRNARTQAAALAPGEYRVHGWLTTVGPAPAYAATAVFTVAAK